MGRKFETKLIVTCDP